MTKRDMKRFVGGKNQQKSIPRNYYQIKANDLKSYEAAIDKVLKHVKTGDLRLIDYDGEKFLMWVSGGFDAQKYLNGMPADVTPVT